MAASQWGGVDHRCRPRLGIRFHLLQSAMLKVAEHPPLEATSSRMSLAEAPDHLMTYLRRLGAEAVRNQGTIDMNTRVMAEPSSNAHRQVLNLVCHPSAGCPEVHLHRWISAVMVVGLHLWTRRWIYEANHVVAHREISAATSETSEVMGVLIRGATRGATYRMTREATHAATHAANPVANHGTTCEAARVATHGPTSAERMHGVIHGRTFAVNRAVILVAICKVDSVACGSQRWAVAAMEVVGRVAWMRPLRPEAGLRTPTHQRQATRKSVLPCEETQDNLRWREAASIRCYQPAAQRPPTSPSDFRRAGRRPEAPRRRRWRKRTMTGSPRRMTGLMKGSAVKPSASRGLVTLRGRQPQSGEACRWGMRWYRQRGVISQAALPPTISTTIGAVTATLPETTMGVAATPIIAGWATLVTTMTDMAAAMPPWTMIGNSVASMTDGPLPRMSSGSTMSMMAIRQERQQLQQNTHHFKETVEALEVAVVWDTMRMRITAGRRHRLQVVAQE